jgi:hypothetical protein
MSAFSPNAKFEVRFRVRADQGRQLGVSRRKGIFWWLRVLIAGGFTTREMDFSAGYSERVVSAERAGVLYIGLMPAPCSSQDSGILLRKCLSGSSASRSPPTIASMILGDSAANWRIRSTYLGLRFVS